MFSADVYVERRNRLREQLQAGLVLLLGNQESPINYADNPYPFRQDSSFLYFFGLDMPGLAAVIDLDTHRQCVFGNELTVEQIIWQGPQPSLAQQCERVGVFSTARFAQLQGTVQKARSQGRKIHFLPQYRCDNILLVRQLLGVEPDAIADQVSEPLIRAVVAQRSLKTEPEIEQIEAAINISYEMQTTAMKMSRPKMREQEVAAAMEGIALARGCRLAFPSIFSIHGETLHNHGYGNVMRAGDIVVNDCGAESDLHYASDVTRSFPVSGKFSARQRHIYQIVLAAQEKAIAAIRPGVEFRDIHRLACTVLACGLKELGLIRGDVEQAVDAGAHTLFFQCGLGHMLGLDVHDMEALGEDYVGYTDTIRRKAKFGWRSLRLAKALEPGFVVTVEPGLYFIPALIDQWKARRRCASFINYDLVEKYRDFGGIRVEDDVLVTAAGHRMLGKKIPKTVEQVEQICA